MMLKIYGSIEIVRPKGTIRTQMNFFPSVCVLGVRLFLVLMSVICRVPLSEGESNGNRNRPKNVGDWINLRVLSQSLVDGWMLNCSRHILRI